MVETGYRVMTFSTCHLIYISQQPQERGIVPISQTRKQFGKVELLDMNSANKQPRADLNPDLFETHCSYQRTMDGVTLSFIPHSYKNCTGALYYR